MNKKPSIFLHHILESIALLEGYMKGVTEEQFLHSSEKQDLAIRRLEVIGEAVRNLPEEFCQQHPNIAWNKAMATRNILIHQYFGIDLEIVWDTVKNSLPEFKAQIESLL
jgi:uncharacterized protein with HEPN domain